MADIAASNVTTTILRKTDNGNGLTVEAQIAFGDASLTYPSGGVPLAKSKLGFNRKIATCEIIESNGDKLLYEYDISAETIRAFFPTQETGTPGNRAGVEFTGASTAPAATTLQIVATGY